MTKKKKKKKTEPIYFWLKFINLILAFSFFLGYEVDSVHEKSGPLYSPTCPEVRVYKIRIILLYFCRSNKKSLWVLFFGGITLHVCMYV